VNRRTAIASFSTLARRTGTTAGRTALTVAREVASRVAERRASRSSTPPGAVPRTPPTARSAPTQVIRRSPSPADVARAVARNAAGLPRTNATPQVRQPAYRSVPGAKLPARAGQGILGV